MYKLGDLKNQGLVVMLFNNTDTDLSLNLTLSVPHTADGVYFPSSNAEFATTEVTLISNESDFVSVPVTVDQKTISPGEYTAWLVVDDGNGSVEQRKVTIYVSQTNWAILILALLIGVAGSWFLTKYIDTKSQRTLNNRCKALAAEIQDDQEDFRKKHGTNANFSINESALRQLQTLDVLITASETDTVKTELTNIQQWFADFRTFRWEQVVTLTGKLSKVHQILTDKGESTDPKCVQKVTECLQGRPIEDKDHLALVKTELQNWINLLDRWDDTYLKIHQAIEWSDALKGCVTKDPDKKSYEENRDKCLSTREKLWLVDSLEQWEADSLDVTAKTIWSALRDMWIKYEMPSAKAEEGAEADRELGTRSRGKIALAEYKSSKIEEFFTNAGTWMDATAIVLSIFSSMLAGLLAVYFAQDIFNIFGKPQDYLVAVLWGFGIDRAVTGIKGVVDVLSKIELRRKTN